MAYAIDFQLKQCMLDRQPRAVTPITFLFLPSANQRASVRVSPHTLYMPQYHWVARRKEDIDHRAQNPWQWLEGKASLKDWTMQAASQDSETVSMLVHTRWYVSQSGKSVTGSQRTYWSMYVYITTCKCEWSRLESLMNSTLGTVIRNLVCKVWVRWLLSLGKVLG